MSEKWNFPIFWILRQSWPQIKVFFLYNKCVNVRVPSENLNLKTLLGPILGDIFTVQSWPKVKFSDFFSFLGQVELLIKVLFLYNRCVHFRVPSEILALKTQLGPIGRDMLLLRSCPNAKSAKMTALAKKIVWPIKI